MVNRSLYYQKQMSGYHRFALLDPFQIGILMAPEKERNIKWNKEATKLQMADSLTRLKIDICYKWSCMTADPCSTVTTLAFGTYSSHSNASGSLRSTNTFLKQVWFAASRPKAVQKHQESLKKNRNRKCAQSESKQAVKIVTIHPQTKTKTTSSPGNTTWPL